MGNLTIEYRRRIAKLLSGKAIVAPKGTNHIDDEWSENTIYKGEIAINLGTGEIVSSDGETIIQGNKGESVTNGLQLYPVPGANNGANPLWIAISSGKGTINGKTYWHTSVVESSADRNNPGDFKFEENKGTSKKYWLVYGRPANKEDDPNEEIYDGTLQQYKMKFFTFAVDSFNKVFEDDLEKYNNTKYSLEDSLFLGVVYMPDDYTVDSYNELRPWSVSINNEFAEFSLNHSSNVDMNQVTPGALVDSIRKSLIEYEPDASQQRRCMVLIEGQTFKSGSNLYYVNETHYCDDIETSLDEGKITQLTGAGEGGTTTDIHSSLKNLSYDKSGHTGFQRQTMVSTSGPETCSFIPKAGDFWINIDNDNTIRAGFVYVPGKGWVEFINCTRDSKDNKNLSVDEISTITFTNKQADTFIAMSVNGIMANYPDDYHFELDGTRVEFEKIDSTSQYQTVWTGDFDLNEDDQISFYYIESAPVVIDTTDWNVLDGGSSTEALFMEK